MTHEEALSHVDAEPILENAKPISCSICLESEIPPGQGVILKDCYHQFCKYMIMIKTKRGTICMHKSMIRMILIDCLCGLKGMSGTAH